MGTVRFEQPLIEGTLIERRRKFVAEVKLNNGDEIKAHCANPGSLLSCSEPGSKVLVSVHDSPRSRFKHHLEIIYAGRVPVGVHTGRPAGVVAEAIGQAKIRDLAGYATLGRDTSNGRSTRIDLVAKGNGLRPCYMKVENVTLVANGTAFFPDLVVPSGPQHMHDLTNLVREGNRAMIMLVAQRSDATQLRLADKIDPEYTQAFRDAVARGVEALCFRAKVTRKGIQLDEPLPIDMSES